SGIRVGTALPRPDAVCGASGGEALNAWPPMLALLVAVSVSGAVHPAPTANRLSAPSTEAVSPAAIVAMVDSGHFEAAEAAIAKSLEDTEPKDPAHDALLFERERMRRILLDFTLDEAAVVDRLKQQVPDLDAAEFARWKQAGLLEHRLI